MIARGRKTSADDYPEHLNPFADDNEDLRNNRFNTTGRRRARPSLKDAWESNPSPALDVAVAVRGPTPARPPPPRLSLSPPPPPPSEVQRQPAAPPPRPQSQPPPPAAPAAPAPAPGKPARRRFSFSRTLDAGSRLLLSPALLRRFRPGAAPAKPPPRDSQPPPAAPDLRGSIRRSQSQAIPTTPPPVGDASGLNSRAGSNWTLAEGGFPQRVPSYRPKKRRAPPPPPQVSAPSPPPAVSVAPAPAERSETTNAEQQAEVGVAGPAAAEVTETTTVVVTVAAPTPPPSSAAEPAVVEVSVAEAAAGGGSPVAAGGQEQATPEAVAPLAEGEDDADLVAADGSRQVQAEEKPSGGAGQPPSEEHPSSDVAVSAGETEPPTPSDVVPTPTETVEVKEEQATEVSKKTAENSDPVELTSTAESEAAPSPESSSSKVASEETPVELTPQVLTLTIREYKEPTAPSDEVTEVSQEAKDSMEGETKEKLPATGLAVVNPTVEVEVKLETTTAAEPAAATESDGPPTETNAKEEGGAKAEEVPEEPRKSALASFREEYLTKHYKADLPVLQITESDLADEEERKEGSPVTKPSTTLPVLHISEEDLREEPAAEKPSEVAEAEKASDAAAVNGPTPAVRVREEEVEERERASPSPRRSLDGGVTRRESPQPPPRQSSAQELNSKIYFRVLPPLAGDPPQLKTFSPPSSPPGRAAKPQPPLRNGVAHAGEASPPRTKSPLPTPRRRHQPLQRDD